MDTRIIGLTLNFVVQQFTEANVMSAVIFHCWTLQTQYAFLKMSSLRYFPIQMVKVDSIENWPGDFLRQKHPMLGVFIDFNCNRSLEILEKASYLQLFASKYHWLIFDERGNLSRFRSHFEEAIMSIDAEVTYAAIINTEEYEKSQTEEDLTSLNQSMSLILYDVYNNGKRIGGKLNVTIDRQVNCNATQCETGHFLSELHSRTKYGNRCHLGDTTFRVAMIVTRAPIDLPERILLEHLTSINNSYVDTMCRFGFQLTAILQDILGYNVKYTPVNTWSVNTTDGGAIGEIVQEQVEFASTPFIPTLARLQYVSMILETGDLRSVFLFRTGRSEGFYGGVFLAPFSPSVWILFCVFLLMFALFLWVTFTIEFHRIKQCCLEFIPSLLSTCVTTFGQACFQGTHLIPMSTGGRMAFLSLSLITFIMYNYYTSLVVSSLIGSPVKSNIKTIDQLTDSSMGFAIEPRPHMFVYFNATNSPDSVRRFFRKRIKPILESGRSVSMQVEEGVSRIREGGFIYLCEENSGLPLIERFFQPHELCDLNRIDLRPEHAIYTILKRNSTYKEIFRLKQIQMRETGVTLKHRRYWLQGKIHCFSNNFLTEVGMEYAGPLFFMLIIAYVFVIIVLLMEIGYKRYIPIESLTIDELFKDPNENLADS